MASGTGQNEPTSSELQLMLIPTHLKQQLQSSVLRAGGWGVLSERFHWVMERVQLGLLRLILSPNGGQGLGCCRESLPCHPPATQLASFSCWL